MLKAALLTIGFSPTYMLYSLKVLNKIRKQEDKTSRAMVLVVFESDVLIYFMLTLVPDVMQKVHVHFLAERDLLSRLFRGPNLRTNNMQLGLERSFCSLRFFIRKKCTESGKTPTEYLIDRGLRVLQYCLIFCFFPRFLIIFLILIKIAI